MEKPQGILLFGANGCGKTTLGHALALKLRFWHLDIEEYAFRPSKIPYTDVRPKAEYISLMLSDIKRRGDFVASTVTGDLGEEITALYRLAVRMNAPQELRANRVKQRGIDRFGERVQAGGDMFEQNNAFLEFAATRPLERIDAWAKTLTCPLLTVDGTADITENTEIIAQRFAQVCKM